jgi:ParB-like nuclease domain
MSDYISGAGSRDAAKSAHEQSLQNGDRYHVEYLPAEEIKPSPENDQLYGKTDAADVSVMALRESIAERGLEEPLILTSDGFILSGHRRFVVCRSLGMTSIPCRIKRDIRRNGNPDYMRDLAAYNPQRVKSAGALLREAILRDSTTLEDTQSAIRRVRATYKPTGDPTYQQVNGFKDVAPISANRQEFLAAVQEVVTRLRPYWPLSIRESGIKGEPCGHWRHVGGAKTKAVGAQQGKLF